MAACLLDTNVLIALLWPRHEQHDIAQGWFRKNLKHGWATCPFTQAAFVRIVSNPAFSRDALSPGEATALLSSNLRLLSHEFWPNHLPFAEAIAPFRGRVHGHRQITDAYLLGLALHRKARVATFDRALSSLLPEGSTQRAAVVEIR